MRKAFSLSSIGLATAGLFFVGCGSTELASGDQDQQILRDTLQAFALANLDSSVDPCTNFYQYAAGGWLKENPVPGTESRWGSFNLLNEANNDKLKEIVEVFSFRTDIEKGSSEQLVGDFYHTAMDTVAIEAAGMTPLDKEVAMIEGIADKDGLLRTVARMRKMGLGPMMGLYVGQDAKDSETYITYISQGGLGLPDRDYYTSTGAESDRIRSEYRDHLQKMFELMGDQEAEANMQVVYAIEKRLADNSMTRTERRDIDKTYNKKTFAELKKSTPNIPWDIYLSELGVMGIEELIVSQPEFYKALNKAVNEIPLEQWKTYLKWNLINGTAPYLSSAFEQQNFAFYSTVLSGTNEMKPRWKRAVNTVSGRLGQPLGKLFVAEHFSEESKEYVANMVENMREVYIERVKQLDWMGDSTKLRAVEKLKAFTHKIGYPEKWRDYSGLEITRGSYVQNVLNTNAHDFDYMVSKLGKEVDRDEWFMSPQTVNAYYSSSRNEIVFPAGILQPPFYTAGADDAINYGGIGAVIGHEFTHGFDDQGSKFDGTGNLNNWWTEEDRTRFEQRADVVVKQFNEFQPIDSVFINGKMTLGENLADLGGLTLAFYALQKEQENKRVASIDGFNQPQRFFLSWAQVWKNNITESELRKRVITDTHSPGEYRVNGPLANMEEFRHSWDCPADAPMVRSDTMRAVIW